MLIGVPKEIKTDEYRVGVVPETVFQLLAHGHSIEIETGAGLGAGIADREYEKAGASIVADARQIFESADLVVKVKEPLASERAMLRHGQTIFTYLHLAADRAQAEELMASGATAIAYETVEDANGHLPLLSPMSKVAGRMAAQVGAHFLERPQGGRGVLFGGVDGAAPARVAILGGGTVGASAARVAVGMGADVSIVVRSEATAKRMADMFGGRVHVLRSDPEAVETLCLACDVVIGAALSVGGVAPKLVSADMVERMLTGAVLVDVAIDQGGCFETSRPTTHSDPTYVVDGVVHYCVANMPGAVPRTSTYALNNATRSFILDLANKGVVRALTDSEPLRRGLNVIDGRIACRAVADALDLPYISAETALGA